MSKRIAKDILIISQKLQDKAFPWVEKGWLDRVTHLESKGVENTLPFSSSTKDKITQVCPFFTILLHTLSV